MLMKTIMVTTLLITGLAAMHGVLEAAHKKQHSLLIAHVQVIILALGYAMEIVRQV